MVKKGKKTQASRRGKENIPKDSNTRENHDGVNLPVFTGVPQDLSLRPSQRPMKGKEVKKPQTETYAEPLDELGESSNMYDAPDHGRPCAPFDEGNDEPKDLGDENSNDSTMANLSEDEIESAQDGTRAKFSTDETKDDAEHENDNINEAATDPNPIDQDDAGAPFNDIGIDKLGNKYPIFPNRLRTIQEQNTTNYSTAFLALLKKHIRPETLFDSPKDIAENKFGKTKSGKHLSYLDLQVRHAIQLAPRNVYHSHIRSEKARGEFDEEVKRLREVYFGRGGEVAVGMKRVARRFNQGLAVGGTGVGVGSGVEGSAGGENGEGSGTGDGSGNGGVGGITDGKHTDGDLFIDNENDNDIDAEKCGDTSDGKGNNTSAGNGNGDADRNTNIHTDSTDNEHS